MPDKRWIKISRCLNMPYAPHRCQKRQSGSTFLGYGLLILLSLLIMTACSTTEAPQTEIIVQLSETHSAEFAGFYAAVEMGYYEDENLIVTLLPRTQTINPVAEVLAGNAQFGIISGDQILRAQDAGNDLVAISSIYQLNPMMIMSLSSDPVLSPDDLIGKRIGVNSANLTNSRDLQLLSLLEKQGIDRNSIELLTTWDFYGAYDLTSGRLSAVSGFNTNREAIYAQVEGDQVAQMFYADYGINLYTNPIFTNGYLTRSQPDLVTRFVRATLNGYQYAIENPVEAARICRIFDNTLDLGLQTEMIRSQIPLIDTGYSPLGWMEDAVWQTTYDILLEQNIIAASLDLNSVWTNLFVENAQ